MELETGIRFSQAPRFANGLARNERLQIGRRPTRDESMASPPLEWRPASDAERSALVANETSDEVWKRDVCLFAIPEHLRARWWEMAARQMETLPAPLDGLEPFARAFAEFAQFKRVPLPPRCAFEVTLTSPEQAVANPSSAASDCASAWIAETGAASSPVVARVNLGDEQTALIFLNLGRARMLEMLHGKRTVDGATIAASPAELVRDFLWEFPAYPLVRLALNPGEAVWLPSADVNHGPDRSGKTDLDVWLLLKAEG